MIVISLWVERRSLRRLPRLFGPGPLGGLCYRLVQRQSALQDALHRMGLGGIFGGGNS